MKILKTGKLSPEGVCLDKGGVVVCGSNEVLIFEDSEDSED